jgi:hypothetical protein
MESKQITFNLKPEVKHALALLPTDRYGNPHKTHVNPIFCEADDAGYIPMPKTAWLRQNAQRYCDEYNRDVLGLSPVEAQAIIDSTFGGKCENLLTIYRQRFIAQNWPSGIGATK